MVFAFTETYNLQFAYIATHSSDVIVIEFGHLYSSCIAYFSQTLVSHQSII